MIECPAVNCPACNHRDSRVINSRKGGNGISRRRQCLKCSHRWSTVERLVGGPGDAQKIKSELRNVRAAQAEIIGLFKSVESKINRQLAALPADEDTSPPLTSRPFELVRAPRAKSGA